jgi:CTP synthase
MILSAKYARENNIPYFGICLGMQIAAIEFARNGLGYKDAHSTEFDPNTAHKIIDFMPDQSETIEKGGTMRLGSYPCELKDGSKLASIYGAKSIAERHRHRYEFNNEYRDEFAKNGMQIVGTSPDNRLVEAIEYSKNDFYVGVQFHPEFKSRPDKAHPIFKEFITAATKVKRS